MGPAPTAVYSPIMPRKRPTSLVPVERIEKSILLIRGEKVMLDFDLADLYGVETRVLVQAVKRNVDRFPRDFLFQLTKEELEDWRSQIVISKPSAQMGLRRRPYAFTEHGVAMLSSVLRSKRAVQVNIEVVRAFVRLRKLLASHEALAGKLAEMEKKYDAQFRVVFDAIRQLMSPPEPKKRPRIGFHRPSEESILRACFPAADRRGSMVGAERRRSRSTRSSPSG